MYCIVYTLSALFDLRLEIHSVFCRDIIGWNENNNKSKNCLLRAGDENQSSSAPSVYAQSAVLELVISFDLGLQKITLDSYGRLGTKF